MINDDIEDLIVFYRSNQQGVQLDDVSIEYIRSELLAWYGKNRRKLPWRGDKYDSNGSEFGSIMNEISFPNSYGTWVSEVMLQQTRVETVIPYWLKWMSTYPTITSLSKASPDDVNKLWAGLGYYRRAQMLLKGAQMVVAEYSGNMPSDTASLLKIPGIGPYTAGAISSIAYGNAAPIVDGNVVRVISRILGTKYPSASKEMEKICWSTSAAILDPLHPGDFNQALMELGATICKPTSADCSSCPINAACFATKLVSKARSLSPKELNIKQTVAKRKAPEVGMDVNAVFDGLPLDVSYFPVKSPKKKAIELEYSVKVFCAVDPDGCSNYSKLKYLLVRRDSKGLLANQWEFPGILISNESEEDSEAHISQNSLLTKFRDYLKDDFGILWDEDNLTEVRFNCLKTLKPPRVVHEPVVHVFSHQRHSMYIEIYEVSVSEYNITNDEKIKKSNSFRESKWMTAEEIIEAGCTTGCKKILTVAQEGDLSILPSTRISSDLSKTAKSNHSKTAKISDFFSKVKP